MKYDFWDKSSWNLFDTKRQEDLVEEHFDFYHSQYPSWISHNTLQLIRVLILLPPLVIFALTLLKIRRSSPLIFLT